MSSIVFQPRSVIGAKAPLRQQCSRGAVRFNGAGSLLKHSGGMKQIRGLNSVTTNRRHRMNITICESGKGTPPDESGPEKRPAQEGFRKRKRSFQSEDPVTRKFEDPEIKAPTSGKKRAAVRAFMRSNLFKQIFDITSLIALFATWYASNILFNIYNKQALNVFPLPTTCTFIHLMCASLMMAAAWVLRLQKPPRITKQVATQVLPLGLLHSSGFVLTNMSLGSVAVSLTHTIKSLEPFFTVVLSFIFLGTLPAWPVLMCLLPIVAGVVVASASDVSFNWMGFCSAMGSNLTFQARNVLSKKTMVESSLGSLESGGSNYEVLDHINLFACISISATLFIIPVMVLLDGGALYAKWTAAGAGLAGVAGIMPSEVFTKSILAGICRTGDVLSSYALLSRINPVSHSVGNCVKRVVVIAASIIFFRTPASKMNIIGTAMALTGVFMYSMASKYYSDPERADLKGAMTGKQSVFERLQLSLAAINGRVLTFFGGKPEEKPEDKPKDKPDKDDKVEFNL